MENRSRRASDKLDDLYDALIGAPGRVGALEEFRSAMRGLVTRVTVLETRLHDHQVEHEKNDQDGKETRRDITQILLRLAERIVVAAFGAVVALAVALQTFLQSGHPPTK